MPLLRCGAVAVLFVVFCIIVLKNLYLKNKKTTEKRESAALNIFYSKWRQNYLSRHVWIESIYKRLYKS